jgi:hypothetical protein
MPFFGRLGNVFDGAAVEHDAQQVIAERRIVDVVSKFFE